MTGEVRELFRVLLHVVEHKGLRVLLLWRVVHESPLPGSQAISFGNVNQGIRFLDTLRSWILQETR